MRNEPGRTIINPRMLTTARKQFIEDLKQEGEKIFENLKGKSIRIKNRDLFSQNYYSDGNISCTV